MALEIVNRFLASADLSDPLVLDSLVEMWNLGKQAFVARSFPREHLERDSTKSNE